MARSLDVDVGRPATEPRPLPRSRRRACVPPVRNLKYYARIYNTSLRTRISRTGPI